jgi:endonuclease YncB( thermonuclease family)
LTEQNHSELLDDAIAHPEGVEAMAADKQMLLAKTISETLTSKTKTAREVMPVISGLAKADSEGDLMLAVFSGMPVEAKLDLYRAIGKNAEIEAAMVKAGKKILDREKTQQEKKEE